jgi:hypothetical protein
MSTLPALVGFQVPNFNLGDTFIQMARLSAYDAQRRSSELEQEEKRGKLDRDRLWRSTIAGAFPTTDPRAPGGLNAMQAQAQPQAQPQQMQAPPVTGGLAGPQPVAQGPSMAGPQGMDINPQTGAWSTPGGLSAPPASPMAPGGLTQPQPSMPPQVAAMAQPPDGAQPPLQGGGFTQASPGTGDGLPTAPVGQGGLRQGLVTPQPQRPLSASVPGLMPMPDMGAVQKAFAIDPEKTSQWYGAYLTQRGKQLDEVDRNNKLVYQVTGAMLENPAYYQEGLDYLRDQGVPVPKNMPGAYNPALVKFHNDLSRQRLDPLQEAQRENQLAQSKLHAAQAQDVPLRTQLEAGRLGLQGTTATMNDELRAMGVNPMAATKEQRQQAQKNIQDRELAQKKAEGLAGAEARTQGEKEARLDKTVSEVFGDRTTKLYDTQTGQTVDSRLKVRDYETMPAGRVRELSANQTEQMENVNNAVPIITQLQQHIDKIYGPGGALARMTPDERADLAAAPERWAKQYAQKYPELIQAQRFIDSNAGALARALAGEKGAMAEGDVERAKAMLPNLTTSLQLWPPSKLAIQQPDTRAVALGTMNNVVDLINGRVRTLLGNEQYTHPKLHRYETADEAQQATGGPGTPPKVAPPALPIPPTTGLNPHLPRPESEFGPALGAPEQKRYVPPGPVPGRQSAVPTAPERQRVVGWFDRPEPQPVMTQEDVALAMEQTGKSRQEILAAARRKGYRVLGSDVPRPEETMVG